MSDDALRGLTVAQAVQSVKPIVGDIEHGLDVWNQLFGILFYGPLPLGDEWLKHLDTLGAVNIHSVETPRQKAQRYYVVVCSGYTDIGMEQDSASYREAIDILKTNTLPRGLLVKHRLNDGYVRIPVPDKASIDSLSIQQRVWQDGSTVLVPVRLTEDQVAEINTIYDLYTHDQGLKERIAHSFMKAWSQRPHLRMLQEWWDNIPVAFSITPAGQALAHANAQQRDENFPPMD